MKQNIPWYFTGLRWFQYNLGIIDVFLIHKGVGIPKISCSHWNMYKKNYRENKPATISLTTTPNKRNWHIYKSKSLLAPRLNVTLAHKMQTCWFHVQIFYTSACFIFGLNNHWRHCRLGACKWRVVLFCNWWLCLLWEQLCKYTAANSPVVFWPNEIIIKNQLIRILWFNRITADSLERVM